MLLGAAIYARAAGTPVATVGDAKFSSGPVGLGSLWAPIRFDNLSIATPASKSIDQRSSMNAVGGVGPH